jgi:hypothetical protein
MNVIKVSTIEDGIAILKEYTSKGEGCVFLQKTPPHDMPRPTVENIIVLSEVQLPESWLTDETFVFETGKEENDDELKALAAAAHQALRQEVASQASLVASLRELVATLRKEYAKTLKETEDSLQALRVKLKSVEEATQKKSAHERAAAKTARPTGP